MKKILVIDDDRLLLKAIQPKLAEAGFETRTAENGMDALEILRQEKFDFILLDWVMPRMNGFEVLKSMRQLRIDTPVIMLSSFGQEEKDKGAEELGIMEVFDKGKTPLDEVVKYIQSKVATP